MSDFSALKSGLVQSIAEGMDPTNKPVHDYLRVTVDKAKAELFDIYQERINSMQSKRSEEIKKSASQRDVKYLKHLDDTIDMLQAAQRKTF